MIKTKKTNKDINSRVYLLNKRDQIDEYIFNSVTHYNEYLLNKSKDNITENFNSLIKDQDDFLSQTKVYLKKIDTMKSKILDKKSDFIVAIKNYAGNFVKQQQVLTEQKIAQIEIDYKTEIKTINSEIEKIENAKKTLEETKNLNTVKLKSQIEQIQKEVNNDDKFNLESETQEIINLKTSHEKFINNEVKAKLNDLNSGLEKLNKNLKKINASKVENIYKTTIDSKLKIKDEFMFLAEIEKSSLQKMIKFKDFLDDVEYFSNDKIEKYKILIANGKAIKAENFKNLMKDTNNLLSFVSNSESIFDNADFLIKNIKNKMQDSSINNKLTDFKNSLLNSNSVKSLQNKDEKGEL